MKSGQDIGRTRGASLMPPLLFALLLLSSLSAVAGASCGEGQTLQIRIGEQTFAALRADSPAKRERGLSGRRQLAAKTGMWFEFETPGWHGFWMQDMNFPIDLVWVAPTRRVLGAITLQPCVADAPCPIHLPPGLVSQVLEINAGEFSGKPGDSVTWRCAPTSQK